MKPSQEINEGLLKIVLDFCCPVCYNSYMKIINNKWTESELRLLKREYGSVPSAYLAARLNKTSSALASKVHYLRKRGWTFDTKRSL